MIHCALLSRRRTHQTLLRARLLHHPAQHQIGPDGTNLQQRRQAEENRGQNAGAQSCQRGMPGKTKIQSAWARTCPNKAGKIHSTPSPREDADQPTHQPQQHRLEKIDAQDVRGARADRLHDGEHLDPLLQMRAHRHRHPDRAQHHGHQADQAEQPGRALQAVGQRGVAFAESR